MSGPIKNDSSNRYNNLGNYRAPRITKVVGGTANIGKLGRSRSESDLSALRSRIENADSESQRTSGPIVLEMGVPMVFALAEAATHSKDGVGAVAERAAANVNKSDKKSIKLAERRVDLVQGLFHKMRGAFNAEQVRRDTEDALVRHALGGKQGPKPDSWKTKDEALLGVAFPKGLSPDDRTYNMWLMLLCLVALTVGFTFICPLMLLWVIAIMAVFLTTVIVRAAKGTGPLPQIRVKIPFEHASVKAGFFASAAQDLRDSWKFIAAMFTGKLKKDLSRVEIVTLHDGSVLLKLNTRSSSAALLSVAIESLLASKPIEDQDTSKEKSKLDHNNS